MTVDLVQCHKQFLDSNFLKYGKKLVEMTKGLKNQQFHLIVINSFCFSYLDLLTKWKSENFLFWQTFMYCEIRICCLQLAVWFVTTSLVDIITMKPLILYSIFSCSSFLILIHSLAHLVFFWKFSLVWGINRKSAWGCECYCTWQEATNLPGKCTQNHCGKGLESQQSNWWKKDTSNLKQVFWKQGQKSGAARYQYFWCSFQAFRPA